MSGQSSGDNKLNFNDGVQQQQQQQQQQQHSTNATFNSSIENVIPNVAAALAGEPERSVGRQNLRKWLGKTFRVVISDGRILVGFFNCTDKDANVVLSLCTEYVEEGKDARILGNVMIPGKHIVSISVDMFDEEEANATNAGRAAPAAADKQ